MGNDYLIKFIIKLGRYRGGSNLIDISIIDDDQMQLIQEARTGKWDLYLGEVMGKHSEVEVNISDEEMVEFEVLSDDAQELELFKKWFPKQYLGNFSILDAIQYAVEIIEEEREEEERLEAESNE